MIKPIRSLEDLTAAKSRMSALIRANKTGVHDDEIDVLSTLIEQYERNIAPIDEPSPVAAIRFRMDQLGLAPRDLEPYVGSRARVSEVLSGKRQLSIDMIRSLHEGLGIPYESLIARRPPTADISSASAPALDRLTELGVDFSAEDVQTILGHRHAPQSSLALHKRTRTQRAASKTDPTALLFWQAAVLKRGEGRSVAKPFERSEFDAAALRKLARLSVRPDGPLRAVATLSDHGVATVVLPPLPGTFLDGAALVTATGTPVIGLTLRHDRLDSFWFTVLHEAAHISLHYDLLVESGAAFIDDMEMRSEDLLEREADTLARESLIPSSVLAQIPWDNDTTHDELLKLAVMARVHIAIAAGRWQRDHQNYKKFSRLIDRGIIRGQLSQALEPV
jgi:HTH-type transcriptional regulator / antitoxin HigA